MARSDNNAYRREFEQEVPGEGWAVVIHDDDIHEMRQFLCALRRAAGIPCCVALEITWQASLKGRAIVTITSRQRAAEIAGRLRAEQLRVELLPC